MSSDPSSVEFIEYHLPPMESGIYRVHVEQSVGGGTIPTTPFAVHATFAVTGERFSYLTSQDIFAIFPAAGHEGDYQNVLPHVTLTRSTLPWERAPDGNVVNGDHPPWLTLLLLRESDFTKLSDRPQLTVTTLDDLQGSCQKHFFPSFTLEPGQHSDDKVTVIDVKKSLLAQILPRKSDLHYLAHVRQTTDDKGTPLGDELATVFCNRLPQDGGSSTAYLVSVEDRYAKGEEFDYLGAKDEDSIRLVCLQSFTFSCPEEPLSFTKLLQSLDNKPSTLMLPESIDTDANRSLSAGYVPMPHKLRQGGRTVSWYRGPLAPGSLGPTDQNADVLCLPVQAADALLRYDSSTGMFDVSYAAAWELGRLLTLQNKGISKALYNWKRSTSQALLADEQAIEHLPLTGPITDLTVPDAVAAWFKRLGLLQGIPFNYLVPDERMLPVESIRFFRIDPHWVECLIDGAFSIGRVTGTDMKQDKDNRPSTSQYASLSGFLLRSSVVSGWPGLIVDGYDQVITGDTFETGQTPLTLLRMDRLSPNVLFCLFAGEVTTVDIHLAPETMHFGVDPVSDGEKVTKTLRSEKKANVTVPMRGDSKLEVIDIAGLVGTIKMLPNVTSYTSADFALDMIEGVQKVRFINQGG